MGSIKNKLFDKTFFMRQLNGTSGFEMTNKNVKYICVLIIFFMLANRELAGFAVSGRPHLKILIACK